MEAGGKYVINWLTVVMTSTFVLPILDLDHHQKIDKNQNNSDSVMIIKRVLRNLKHKLFNLIEN